MATRSTKMIRGNKLIPAVRSLSELRRLAGEDARYARLALITASNLGGDVKDGKIETALRILEVNADETMDDQPVVAEVNACRDLL